MYLREVTESDIDFIAMLRADPEVMRYYPSTLTREECQALIERIHLRYQEDGHHFWLVVDRASDEPIGMAGLLMQTVHAERIPEIGYMIWKEHWRQGLASEAALAIKDYAFNTLNYPFVISLIRPVNVPSQGVARKMGMEPWKTSIHAKLEHIVFRVDKSGDRSWTLKE